MKATKTVIKILLAVAFLFVFTKSGKAQSVCYTCTPSTVNSSTVTLPYSSTDLLQLEQVMRLVYEAIISGTTTGSGNVVVTNTPLPIGGTTQDNIVSNTASTVNRITGLTTVESDKSVTGTINVLNTNPTGAGTAGSFIGFTTSNPLTNVGSCLIQVTGTYNATLQFQLSVDGVNWVLPFNNEGYRLSDGAQLMQLTGGSTGLYRANLNGAPYFRVVCTAYTSGTASVTINAGQSEAIVSSAYAQISPSTNNIGYLLGVGAAGASGVTPGNGGTNLGKAEDNVHSSGDVGVLSLGVQYSSLTAPNANNDYTQFSCDDLGKQIVQPYTHLTNAKNACTSALTTTTSTQVFAAAGASVRSYITSISIVNEGATGTAVSILDGSTVIWKGYVSATSGYNDVQFPTPLKGTANTAINVQCTTAGGSVTACLTAFNAL